MRGGAEGQGGLCPGSFPRPCPRPCPSPCAGLCTPCFNLSQAPSLLLSQCWGRSGCSNPGWALLGGSGWALSPPAAQRAPPSGLLSPTLLLGRARFGGLLEGSPCVSSPVGAQLSWGCWC